MTSRFTVALLITLAVLAGGVLLMTSRGSGKPARTVILYGDSLSTEAGPWIRRGLARAGGIHFVSRAFPGTAPCDWLREARSDARSRPAVVIVQTFGNNQSRCQLTGAGNRPRSEGDRYWHDYRRDLRRLASRFASSTTVLLVTSPAAANDEAAGRSHARRMARTMERAASGLSNVRVIDAGRAVEDRAGRYTRALPCLSSEPCPGDPRPGWTWVRAEDGLHFCPPVLRATLEELSGCPVRASGAWRYARAQLEAILNALRSDRST